MSQPHREQARPQVEIIPVAGTHLLKRALHVCAGRPPDALRVSHPFAPTLAAAAVHGRAACRPAGELWRTQVQRARAAVSHRTGHGRLVSRLAGGRSGVRYQVRELQGRAEPACLVVAGGAPRCAGDPLSAWRALEPDRPGVSHRAIARHGVFGAGHRLPRVRPEPR